MQKPDNLQALIKQLKSIQDRFYSTFQVADIISNSKIFEIMIADVFGHTLLPKLSGSRDAKDSKNGQYEYKHYKETSSNHSWTFNDYSDTTIEKLAGIKAVVFTHIDDTVAPSRFDWYYFVPGKVISTYLYEKTKPIKNKRKMINVSPKQIEETLNIKKTDVPKDHPNGKYASWISKISAVATKIEKLVDTKNILTSNKFWELLIAIKMNHKVLSEQKAYDAVDKEGNHYEYKVARSYSWAFEDISENVLNKFKNIKAVLLAKVDKKNFLIENLYIANPIAVAKKLRQKLKKKHASYKSKDKKLRRLQVSLTKKEILQIKGKCVYSHKH